MASNPNLDFDFHDASVRVPINSANGTYVRQAIADRIRRASIIICLIGNGTAWRDWVDWELQSGYDLGKGLCGVRLKGTRGQTPDLLKAIDAPVASWDMGRIIAVIEQAAARRS